MSFRRASVLVWHPLAGLLLVLGSPAAALSQPAASGPPHFEAQLQRRLASDPNDASTWRLLGRARLRRGDRDGALAACRRAVELDPQSAAAHFDLGRVMVALEQREQAAGHFARVTALAPGSEYANEASEFLQGLPPPPESSEVVPASYESEPNRFGGSAVVTPAPPAGRHFDFRLEMGAVFNSNVQLAPLSREIFAGDATSYQLFASPQLEYRWLQTPQWISGFAFDSYFNLNEHNLRRFNLQSIEPGVFVQHPLGGEDTKYTGRLQYDFGYDAFAGRTFGTRHSLTTSLYAYASSGAFSVLYWQVDYSDFADDGAVPSVTSLDGWTHTLGFSHEYDPGLGPWELLRGGVDLQWADLRGSNFAYNGVYLYTESEISLLVHTWLTLQGGWGYRDYPDFTFTPSRNENVWRAAVELHHQLNPCWSITGLFAYDRFDSRNAFFEADRYVAGLKLTYVR